LALRELPSDVLGRVFGLAREQLHQNFMHLANCINDLAKNAALFRLFATPYSRGGNSSERGCKIFAG
jgi:hypothetical protein